jgi:hypothetical protein
MLEREHFPLYGFQGYIAHKAGEANSLQKRLGVSLVGDMISINV